MGDLGAMESTRFGAMDNVWFGEVGACVIWGDLQWDVLFQCAFQFFVAIDN